MIISVLALLARGSTYGLTVAMIAGNLIYHLPHRGRWMYNTMAVTIASALTLGVDHVLLGTEPSSALVDVTKLVEVIVILILTILVGSVVRRQRVRSIVVEQRLSRLALVDGLTGVASRRRAEEVLADELEVAGPARPLSLILLDLDDFKAVNDTFGHNLGDEVLRGVARLLQQRGRLSDTVGRWGGEEFVVICPDTPVTGALGLAEQLRERIARLEIVGVGRRTASLGVAEAAVGDTIDTLIARADGALYAAKHAGRNRVREAGAPPGPMPS
jgi:diguanylate cyclase (GGDEF)-like protein